MKWYVIVKVWYVLWSSFGPYQTRQECQDRLVQIHSEGMSRYNSGERVTFMGKQVDPDKVSMSCKLK